MLNEGVLNMDQKDYLKKVEKIYDLIEETHNKKLDIWIENVVFTWQWRLGVFLTVAPWILWFYLKKKKESAYRLLCKMVPVVRTL